MRPRADRGAAAGAADGPRARPARGRSRGRAAAWALAGVIACVLAPAATARAAGGAAGGRPAATGPEAGPATTRGLEASRGFVARLRSAGRASASLERRVVDPLTGAAGVQRARISLEPPDRARLDVRGTGESVTLRSDGGEWLQPALGQMLRLEPRAAEAALRWWSLLLPGGAGRFSERRVGPREFVVTATAGASGPADSARVELDGAGLPSRLRFRDAAGEPVEIVLSGWRFGAARGRAAFVLVAPPGTVVVDLP